MMTRNYIILEPFYIPYGAVWGDVSSYRET
jgi:hypothetical protein